jgi:potassium uptake TrkH family protein
VSAVSDFRARLLNRRDSLLRWGQGISFAVSLITVGFILYYYGFPHSPSEKEWLVRVILSLFAFYVLHFVLRVVLAPVPQRFVVENWQESALMVLITLDSAALLVLDQPILPALLEQLAGVSLTGFYLLFIQLYLLLFIMLDLARVAEFISRVSIKPATLLAGSFFLLILVGTVVLMMPEMRHAPGGMPFFDALFTATSASCVTGLIVVDTGSYFTFAGQLVIMLLFQLGGLGIITFTVFFSLLLRSGIALKSQLAMKELLNTSNLVSTQGMLRQVVVYTLVFESLGAFCMYFLWDEGMFEAKREQLYHSVFHAVSAFCNAGFSLYPNGLAQAGLVGQYGLHLVVAVLIFFGGLGFPALQDLFSYDKVRRRWRYRWKGLEVSTKIALFTSLALLVAGAVVIWFLEREALRPRSPIGQLMTALFQSMTTRTAGFNTMDIGALQTPTLLLFLLLMFVGASSASTGGGIKTSTFVVLFKAGIAVIQGRRHMNLGKRSISPDTLNKAYAVFLFATSTVFLSVFALSLTDPQIPVLDLVFEEVSAFCTVGLTTGVTEQLSTAGRLIIIFNMFIGRVGILTLALSLSTAETAEKYRYPKAHLIIG